MTENCRHMEKNVKRTSNHGGATLLKLLLQLVFDLMNYLQNFRNFIKTMLKIHQIIVEISSNLKNFKIHLMKILQIDDENSSFV